MGRCHGTCATKWPLPPGALLGSTNTLADLIVLLLLVGDQKLKFWWGDQFPSPLADIFEIDWSKPNFPPEAAYPFTGAPIGEFVSYQANRENFEIIGGGVSCNPQNWPYGPPVVLWHTPQKKIIKTFSYKFFIKNFIYFFIKNFLIIFIKKTFF